MPPSGNSRSDSQSRLGNKKCSFLIITDSSAGAKRLAEQLEISRQLVSQLECGSKRKPSAEIYQSVQSDTSELSEIANELTLEYQKQLEELKNNVKQKLKKLKSKGSDKSIERSDREEKKPVKQKDRAPSPIDEKLMELVNHGIKKRHEVQDKFKNIIREEMEKKIEERAKLPKGNYSENNVSGDALDDFMANLDDFFTEKIIERLESDERIAKNPYYHLYKEMLQKNKVAAIEKYMSGRDSSKDSSERHERSERQEIPERRDRQEKSERQEKQEKPNRLERSERPEREEKSIRQERHEKQEKQEKQVDNIDFD